jgi:hypothetical protein
VNAGRLSLQTTFDKEGRARLQIPLFQESTDITWTAGDGPDKTETVRFAGARDAFRIALVWRQPLDLQLHVVEPGGTVNGVNGHVWRKQRNEDFKSGIGGLQIDADGATGSDRIEVYDAPPARNPRNGLFKVYVDFAARGDIAAPPYCGSGEMAAPSFDIWSFITAGSKARDGSAFAPRNADPRRRTVARVISPTSTPRREGVRAGWPRRGALLHPDLDAPVFGKAFVVRVASDRRDRPIALDRRGCDVALAQFGCDRLSAVARQREIPAE